MFGTKSAFPDERECDRYEIGFLTGAGLQFITLGGRAQFLSFEDGFVRFSFMAGRARTRIRWEDIVILSRFEDPPLSNPQG